MVVAVGAPAGAVVAEVQEVADKVVGADSGEERRDSE